MALVLEPATIPLREDQDGTQRVGETRVTLDTVIGAWLDGAGPEEITQAYPVLELADVYSVIAYYLTNRDAVTRYLRQRSKHASATRVEIEADFPPVGLRARLMSRRAKSPIPA